MFDSTAAPIGPIKTGAPRKAGRKQGRLTPYLFLAPFLLLFTAVLILPLLMALDLSLFRDTLARGTIFVGLANYTDILADPALWSGLGHVLLFGAVQIPVMLGFALLLALVLDSGVVWCRDLFRIVLFLPYAVPSVIGALIWAYIYGPSFGLFTRIGHALSIAMPNFLGPHLMLASLGNVVTWEYTGYNMIVLYAALQAVPRDVIEASWVCGARPWQTALSIRLPLIGQAILLTVIFSIIGTLQLFNEPAMFRPLAPDIVADSYTPNLYAYALAFTDQRLNASAALSFILGAIVAIFSYVFMLATQPRGGERS